MFANEVTTVHDGLVNISYGRVFEVLIIFLIICNVLFSEIAGKASEVFMVQGLCESIRAQKVLGRVSRMEKAVSIWRSVEG